MSFVSPCNQLLKGLLIDNPIVESRWSLSENWRSTNRLGLGFRLGLGLGLCTLGLGGLG